MGHEFTWLAWLSSSINHHNMHIVMGAIIAGILIGLAYLYKRSLGSAEAEIVPNGQVSAKNIWQVVVEKVYGFSEEIIGPNAKQYFPLIGTLFIYIFVNNLVGIVPGFHPATSNINTNFACALTVFVYFNYVGIKKQGLGGYFGHMWPNLKGPLMLISLLIFTIEVFGLFIRPVTLSVRLFGNLTGDHIVLGIFSDLVPLLVPIIFLAFGVFVALVQAFVFTLLTSVYIGMAVADEEH